MPNIDATTTDATKPLTGVELRARDTAIEAFRRVELLGNVRTDFDKAIVRRAVLTDNLESLQAFIRDWVWTYDPRSESCKTIPFLPWKEQTDFITALFHHEKERKNLFVDKSRDTGLTWLVCAYYVHRWLSVPGWAGSIGSRKADLLDRASDPRSVFWKVRFIIRNLPAFLLPTAFREKKHSAWARIHNPFNGATITGEAGSNMGRGGRSSAYFLDEFGKMPQALEVESAVAGNTDFVLYATTATAPGTRAHTQRHSGTLDIFEMSWENDPRRTQDFRIKLLRDFGQEIVAREYDRQWSALSAVSVIPTAWVRAAVNLQLTPSKNAKTVAGFDVADGGSAESVNIIRQGGLVLEVDVWAFSDVNQGALRAAALADKYNASDILIDAIGVGAGAVGTIRNRITETQTRQLNSVGIVVSKPPSRRRYEDDDEDSTAKQRFINLKAELWWQLRLRFKRTYEFVNEDIEYEPDELISIPQDPLLIGQLSAAQIEYANDGRIKVESKEAMKKRGIASPDRADALVLAFADHDAGVDWSEMIPDASAKVAHSTTKKAAANRSTFRDF